MKNYLMTDDATGEDFIVEALDKEEAMETAEIYFNLPRVIDEISDFEAETLGYDTY